MQWAKKAPPNSPKKQKMRINSFFDYVDLLSDIEADKRSGLLSRSSLEIYRRGECIIHAGDDSDAVFVLLHGRVDIVKSDPPSPRKSGFAALRVGEWVIALESNAVFGERALHLVLVNADFVAMILIGDFW